MKQSELNAHNISSNLLPDFTFEILEKAFNSDCFIL